MEIDEAFLYTTRNDIPLIPSGLPTDPGGLNRTTTDNSLIGTQAGIQVIAPFRRAGLLRFSYKLGLAYNSIDKEIRIDGGDSAVSSGSASSWINEINVESTFMLNKYISSHVGFQFLSVSDLALATDNFHDRYDGISVDEAQPIAGGNVVYISPFVGVSAVY